MSVEVWKSFFDLAAVILLFLTFLAGAGVLFTGNVINRRQAAQLKQFDSDLTRAKSDLASQQERAAKAEGNIALAEQHSAEANAKAEGFRLEIAKANEESARAQAQVAGARADAAKANLELARLKLPRQLSAEQQKSVVAVLVAWPRQRFSFSVSGDSEALDLLTILRGVLKCSGWVQEPPVGFGDINIGDAALGYGRGVIIRFSPTASPQTVAIANALADVLVANGVASKAERDARISDPKSLNVLVGTKPLA
jgi:multidrug efflux pump subunit AcrA (membrane-fusion protein)